MFENEKKNEALLQNIGKKNVSSKFKSTKTLTNEFLLNNNKDSIKIGENSSEMDGKRLSLKNINSDIGLNIFGNYSETTNSNNSSNSHKNLASIKFFLNYKEDERTGGTGTNNSTIMNVSYYFKTHYISYMCNLLSHSIGFESIWRFPYYFINAEGAVFFIPFLLFYFLLGIPILTIESALGQIFKSSPVVMFSIIKQKIDINYNYSVMTMKIITLFIAYGITIYFSSLTAQTIHYFLLSFNTVLPWSFQLNSDKLYHSSFFKTKFINHDSTHQNFDIFRLGEINYLKLLSTFITWVIFYILITANFDRKKHKYINRFLSFYPIIMIFILIIVCFHPSKGFNKGCVYFLIPQIGNLLNYRPWICGINQAIFLLMLGYGKNFLFSSSIKEKDNVYSRSTLTSLIILFLGIACTFFDCIYAGLIAEELNIDSINKIPFNNSDIPILTNLLAIGMMKHNRLFSFLFLSSIIIIGFQSQLLVLRNFCNFLHKLFHQYLSEKTAPIVLCIISFIFCIPFTRFQGQFFLEWIDKYISYVPLIFIVFYEIIFIMKQLGINLLLEIISNKTNIVLPLYIFYFTKYISPIVLIIIMVFAFIYQYQNTQYSTLTKIIEWTILLSPFIIFFISLIRDCLSKKKDINKGFENIIKNGIFTEFRGRKNERKKTEMPVKFLNIPTQIEKPRNSSFTYGYSSSRNFFSNSNDNSKNDIENYSNQNNYDNIFNYDNSITVSETNTRKPTIEMEILGKNSKK